MPKYNDANIVKLVKHLIKKMSVKELVEVVSKCDLEQYAFGLLYEQYTEDEDAFYDECEKAGIE